MNTVIILRGKDERVKDFGQIRCVDGVFYRRGYFTARIERNSATLADAFDAAVRELETGRWFACCLIFMGNYYYVKGNDRMNELQNLQRRIAELETALVRCYDCRHEADKITCLVQRALGSYGLNERVRSLPEYGGKEREQ